MPELTPTQHAAEVSSRAIDLVGLEGELARKATIANEVVMSGEKYLDDLGNVRGEFDSPSITVPGQSAAGIRRTVERARQHSDRYSAAATALVPIAFDQLEASSTDPCNRDYRRLAKLVAAERISSSQFLREIEHPDTGEPVTVITADALESLRPPEKPLGLAVSSLNLIRRISVDWPENVQDAFVNVNNDRDRIKFNRGCAYALDATALDIILAEIEHSNSGNGVGKSTIELIQAARDRAVQEGVAMRQLEGSN